MKIVKIYYKEVDDATPRWYIRKVSGSHMVALSICQTDEQYNYLKEHPKQAWDYSYNNKYKVLQDYRDGKLVTLGMPLTKRDSEEAINKIANYIKSQNDSFRIEDIVRAYSRWYVSPKQITGYLDNEYLETYDGATTIFHIRGNSHIYSGSDQLDETEYISVGARNDGISCNECDLTDINEDSDHMRYIERVDCYACQDCYDDYYSYCESCNESDHRDNLYWSDRRESYYCENCDSGDYDDNGAIQSYDYCPPITFYDYKNGNLIKVDDHTKTNLPFYGAELEVESNDDCNKYELAETIAYYGGDAEKFCYCKNDGSLHDGFEVCFMPMTFYAIKNFNFHDAVLKHRGRGRILSYNTSTCGMHIHINREAFSDHHLFKFITFIHEFKSFVYLISQRKKAGELNSYARFNNGWKDRAKKQMVSSIKTKKVTIANNRDKVNKSKVDLHSTVHYGEKYVPINLQHTNTVEIRIFKGNLREVSFRKNFEFVDSLYYFTRDNPVYKLKLKEFVNHCTNEKKKYPNLNMFLSDNSSRLKETLRFPLSVPEGLDY